MLKYFLLLPLCFSCTKSSQWSHREIHTAHAPFDSHCLYYRTLDPINGIDIQILRTQEMLSTYLQVHSQGIPLLKTDPQKVKVTFISENEKRSFLVECHQGGQRLLLPSSVQQVLLDLLQKNSPVTIELEGYSETVHPESFLQKMDKSSFKIPFHLPF